MPKTQSWEVSDELWEKVRRFVPEKKRDPSKGYSRKPGGGRKPNDPRKIFSGIVFVLRTGIHWKALPKGQFGSPSSVHRNFKEWKEAGFFDRIWKAGIAELDGMDGIAWEWQSADSSSVKAPLALETVGANPTDRGKKRNQKARTGRRQWNPAVDSRDRGQ